MTAVASTAMTAAAGGFALSDTERMVRETADAALASFGGNARLVELEATELGYDPGAWTKMTSLGWPGFALPEPAGGGGGSPIEVGQLIEAVGWAAYPSPLLEVTCAASVLAALAPSDPMAALPTSGEIVVLAAPIGDAGGAAIRPLAWAAAAAALLVLAPRGDGHWTLRRVDRDALAGHLRTARSLDNERLALVDVAALTGEIVADAIADHAAGAALDRVRLLRAAEMAGGAERTLVMTRDYMLERQQFGKPLGSFQAVQHHLADMRTAVDAALLTVREGLSLVEVGAPAAKVASSAAIAGFVAGRSYTQVTITAAQLFAGVGATKDHRLHHHFRRAKAMQLRLGSRASQLQRIADTAVLGEAPGPWATTPRRG
jgi:alkylation response protein AidB-like acyl-CoA dehydrogenase